MNRGNITILILLLGSASKLFVRHTYQSRCCFALRLCFLIDIYGLPEQNEQTIGQFTKSRKKSIIRPENKRGNNWFILSFRGKFSFMLPFLRVLKYHNEIISIGFVVGADVVLHLLLRRLNSFFVDVSVLLLVCFFFIAFLLSFLSLRGEQS